MDYNKKESELKLKEQELILREADISAKESELEDKETEIKKRMRDNLYDKITISVKTLDKIILALVFTLIVFIIIGIMPNL